MGSCTSSTDTERGEKYIKKIQKFIILPYYVTDIITSYLQPDDFAKFLYNTPTDAVIEEIEKNFISILKNLGDVDLDMNVNRKIITAMNEVYKHPYRHLAYVIGVRNYLFSRWRHRPEGQFYVNQSVRIYLLDLLVYIERYNI